MKSIKVAIVQQKNVPDTKQNLEHTICHIREAASQGAQLILLQELHRSLYFCQTENPEYFDLAESIPGDSTDALGSLAEELGVVIVASLFEKRAAGLYHNTAVALERDGSIAGTYRKMHIPDDPGFYEKFYFTPGDAQSSQKQSGFMPIDTSIGRLGILVCWDQWYPEAARLMALAGAELLLYPTAIGWDPEDSQEEQQRQLDAWITIQRAHAIANGVPVLVANRTGHEPDPSGGPGIQFWGNSFIAGPQGQIEAQAVEHGEQILVGTINMGETEHIRRIWPYFRDRRIDAYEDLTKRYRD